MISGARQFLLICFIFFLVPAAAQDKNGGLPLKQVLEQIEKQHSVKFNYIVEEVTPIKLVPPPAGLELNGKLDYIEENTSLNFMVSGSYITLYTRSSTKFICGYVLNKGGRPIEKAEVTCPATAEKVLTDKRGYFEFSLQASGDIEVFHASFQPVSLHVDDFNEKQCRQIKLDIQVTMLEEIVTQRYLTSGITRRKDGSFVISPKKFGILPGLIEPDVLLTMQQLPGINSIDETVSNINVRGGTHDQNLFMWNGIRLFQTGHFFGLISALNPNIANEIRISKNGTSAFYGESVSSTVDISSRSQGIEDGNTSVGTNMINIEYYTKIKATEKASFELSARRSFTDIIAFPTYNKYSKRIFQNTIVTELNNSTDVNYKSDKEFYFIDFTGQYHQKFGDKHDFYLDLIGIRNNLDFTEGTITETNVVTRYSSLDQLTLGGTMTWKTAWSGHDRSEVSLYGSMYNVDGKNASIESSREIIQQNIIHDRGFRFSHAHTLSPLFTVYGGYQFNEISIENSEEINMPMFKTVLKNVLRTHSAIGEAEYNSTNNMLYARAGLRANYISQLSLLLAEPRLQVTYGFGGNFSLELLAELKSQGVSQVVELQEDFLGIEKRRWVLADNEQEIPVQQSRQVSAGVSFRRNNWLVSLENFYKKVKGITTAGQAFQDRLEAVLAPGSYTVYGTEFLIQKQYEGFYTWLSYSWNNNQYSFEGITPASFSSNFEISHTISTAAIYEWNNLKVAFGYKWFTGRPYTAPLSNDPIYNIPGIPEISYGSPNSENLSDFFQANLSASYTWSLPRNVKFQLGVSVLNLFNRQNIINRHYRINSETNAIEQVDTYALERTPNVMAKFIF